MAGQRVGYVYGPSALVSAVCLVLRCIMTCTHSLSQYVALAALKGLRVRDGEGGRV